MDFQIRKRLALFLAVTGAISMLCTFFVNAEMLFLGIALCMLGYCLWPKVRDRG